MLWHGNMLLPTWVPSRVHWQILYTCFLSSLLYEVTKILEFFLYNTSTVSSFFHFYSSDNFPWVSDNFRVFLLLLLLNSVCFLGGVGLIGNVSFGSLKVQGESLVGQRFCGSCIDMVSQNIGKVSSYQLSRNWDWTLAFLPLWLSQGISILTCYSPFCLRRVHLVNKIARITSPSRVRMTAKVISATKIQLYSFLFRLCHDQRQLLVTS